MTTTARTSLVLSAATAALALLSSPAIAHDRGERDLRALRSSVLAGRSIERAPQATPAERAPRPATPRALSRSHRSPFAERLLARFGVQLPGAGTPGEIRSRAMREKSLGTLGTRIGPARLSATLLAMVKASRAGDELPASRLGDAAIDLLRGDELKLDLLARAGREDGLAEMVRAVGGEVLAQSGLQLTVYWPYESLPAIERMTALRAARLSARVAAENSPRLRVRGRVSAKSGQIDSEAVAWSGADLWQEFDSEAHGITRDTAVRVAIVDLGFLGYAEMLGSDLPSSVTTRDFAPTWDIEGCLDNDPLDPCIATGTALAEIVHDMDPAAELTLIAVDGDSVESMRDATDYLLGGGEPRADIVLSGLAWSPGFYGDGFGEGMFNGMIREVIDAGMMWVNDTGRLDYLVFLLYGRDLGPIPPPIVGHWTGPFEDNVDHFFGGTFENDGYMDRWLPGDDPQSGDTWLTPFCLGPKDMLLLDLVWTDWIDGDGDGIPETEDDYSVDIFTRTAEDQLILYDSSAALAINYQGGEEGDYPWDSFLVTNGSESVQCYELAIFADYAFGTDSFHLFWAGDNEDAPGTVTASFEGPVASGHGDRMIPADTEGVIAVGTIDLASVVEDFSLYGLEGEGRPMLCAPADVSTRSFSPGTFATSFAAAHVAGAGSLLMTKLGFVTHEEAIELLEARAREITGDETGIKCGRGGLCMLTGECR